MPNKDNLVIQPNGKIISHTASKSDVILFDEEKRQKVIQILRQSPSVLDLVKKFSGEKNYQACFSPEVWRRIKDGSAKLDNKGDGFFGVMIRDVETGHITNHASLKEITPDSISSLNELAIQQTLADVVRRLEVIDEKITDVLQGQFNDRLAEVESGIHAYEQAIAASDPDRRGLMVNAIHELNNGRNKLIKSTDFTFIDELPRSRLDMFFSRNWDIPKHVQLKAEIVWKATHAIVKASRYLVLAYSDLNQPDSLRVSLEQVKSDVVFFQDKIREILNCISPTSNLHERFTTLSQGILPDIHDLDDIPQKTIVVEFQPKEIAPPEGVDSETLQS